MAFNRELYPDNWTELRDETLDMARNRCERCLVENKTMRGNTFIVLTISHLDHCESNNVPENRFALCQRCHLDHDQADNQYRKAYGKRYNDPKYQLQLFEEARDLLVIPEWAELALKRRVDKEAPVDKGSACDLLYAPLH